MNYFFPQSSEMTSSREISVCLMSGNTLSIVKLTDIKNMSANQLRKTGYAIANHVMETFDEEESENGNIILAEIERLLIKTDLCGAEKNDSLAK